MKPFLATTIADRPGHLSEKVDRLLPRLADLFDGVAILITTSTHVSIVRSFESAGAFIIRAESNADSIGLHRRESVRLALEHGDADHFVYFDLDHLLRWIELDDQELGGVLEKIHDADFTVIGRGPRSFAALPERLARTETIVNHIFELITGHRWDLMMAARGLSRTAAELIVEKSNVNTIGNDVDWPLLCWKAGLTMAQVEAEGLTYKTNLHYGRQLADDLDTDPAAWADRIIYAYRHVQAMLPYIEDRS